MYWCADTVTAGPNTTHPEGVYCPANQTDPGNSTHPEPGPASQFDRIWDQVNQTTRQRKVSEKVSVLAM